MAKDKKTKATAVAQATPKKASKGTETVKRKGMFSTSEEDACRQSL